MYVFIYDLYRIPMARGRKMRFNFTIIVYLLFDLFYFVFVFY